MKNYTSIVNLRDDINKKGDAVIIKSQLTREIIKVRLIVDDINSFRPNKKVLEKEKVSHFAIAQGFIRMKKELKKELTTRKATFISHHCVSYIHLLIREELLYVIVNFRSSNIEKLETDLFIIFKNVKKLMKDFKLKKYNVIVNIDSAHKIIGGTSACSKYPG